MKKLLRVIFAVMLVSDMLVQSVGPDGHVSFSHTCVYSDGVVIQGVTSCPQR